MSDWICPIPKCANLNYARRTSCNRCGKDRPEEAPGPKKTFEIGKAAAEKSKGLFAAEDWQCPKCGNVNWARRSTCNLCNAPKFIEEEARTGLGGGFNERENVEYIEREESDDEFDEFGRKKKKFRQRDDEVSSAPLKKPAVAVEKEEEDEEEEEEDDDDDEDGDLSKYDLSGWDVEDTSASQSEKDKEARAEAKDQRQSVDKRSRSRSRSPRR